MTDHLWEKQFRLRGYRMDSEGMQVAVRSIPGSVPSRRDFLRDDGFSGDYTTTTHYLYSEESGALTSIVMTYYFTNPDAAFAFKLRFA